MSAGHTPTPWGWVIHDHSLASLGVLPDPGLGDPLVMAVGPCESCAARGAKDGWIWGLCHTPSEEDAHFIVRAVNAHDELVEALQALVPNNVALGNPAWSDDTVVSIDVTLGELRRARAALSKSLGNDGGEG